MFRYPFLPSSTFLGSIPFSPPPYHTTPFIFPRRRNVEIRRSTSVSIGLRELINRKFERSSSKEKNFTKACHQRSFSKDQRARDKEIGQLVSG